MTKRAFEPAPPHPMRGWFFDRWLASEFGQHAAMRRPELMAAIED